MAPGLAKSKQSKAQQPNNENNMAAIKSLSAILKTIPTSYGPIKFSELQPFCEYKNNYIWGTVVYTYPLQNRPRKSYLRKFLLIDALDPGSNLQLTVFLLSNFAKESESVKEGDYLGMSDFKVENLTRPSVNSLLMPIQIYVDDAIKSETEDCTHRQIWVARKVKISPTGKTQKGESLRSATKKSPKKIVKECTGAVDESATRSYTYSSLSALSSACRSNQYFSIYGIVDDCHLSTQPASQLQALTLTLSDSTRSEVHCTIFRKENDGPFPDVHPGDIVRIHRLQVVIVRGNLRGRCMSHKFIVVFDKNSKELCPNSTAKTFVYTNNDKEKVKALFLFAETKNSPKLICDIKTGEDITLIVQVIGVFVSSRCDAVILKVWDGTKNYSFERKHLALHEEKLDHNLFKIAKPYYINLFVYGNYGLAAGQLKPGQYIFVRHTTTNRPTDAGTPHKLIIPYSHREGRGIYLLNEEDSRVVHLKCHLEQIRKEAEMKDKERELDREREMARDRELDRERELDGENEERFLNYDISECMSSQPSNVIDDHPPEVSNQQSQIPNKENPVISAVRAAVQPGQSSQEFGGIYTEIGEKRKSETDTNENYVCLSAQGNENVPSKRQKVDDSPNSLQLSWTCSLGTEGAMRSIALEPSQPQLTAAETQSQPQSTAAEIQSQLQSPAAETQNQLQATAAETGSQPLSAVSETGSQPQSTAAESGSQPQSAAAETQSQSSPSALETGLSQILFSQTGLSQFIVSKIGSDSQITASETISKPQSINSETINHLSPVVSQRTNHHLPTVPEIVNHIVLNWETTNASKQTERELTQVLSQLCSQAESSQDNWWRSINDSVSVTDKHSHIQPSLLSDIVKRSVPYKFRVMAITLHFEPEAESVNELICLYCPFCHYRCEMGTPGLEISHSNYDLSLYYCPKCRIAHPDAGRILEYSFLIILNLHDGSGPVSFKVFLWRHHAVKFFKGITPEEALRNENAASSIMEMLWKVCPNCRPLGTSVNTSCSSYPTLDCCIMSYTAGNITRYQIFDTILI